LFIAVPRVMEMQRCSTSDTRRLGARAEMRESVCERALGQCSLILTHWGHWQKASANELSNRNNNMVGYYCLFTVFHI